MEAGACAVGPNQQETVGLKDRAVGDGPFHIVAAVGKSPAGEVYRACAVVEEFEPVAVFAIVRVGDGGGVGGLEFIDQDLGPGRGGQQEQTCGGQCVKVFHHNPKKWWVYKVSKVEITPEICEVSGGRGNPGELVTSAARIKARLPGIMINLNFNSGSHTIMPKTGFQTIRRILIQEAVRWGGVCGEYMKNAALASRNEHFEKRNIIMLIIRACGV
jgi:hypothetical protein